MKGLDSFVSCVRPKRMYHPVFVLMCYMYVKICVCILDCYEIIILCVGRAKCNPAPLRQMSQ